MGTIVLNARIHTEMNRGEEYISWRLILESVEIETSIVGEGLCVALYQIDHWVIVISS